MKLFGRRKNDKNKGGEVEIQPQLIRAGRRHDDPFVVVDAGEIVVHESHAMAPVEGMSMEQLVEENKNLRRELAELKSRIAYVKSVLLGEVHVSAMPEEEDRRGGDVSEGGRGSSDSDLHAMLKNLKEDIAAINPQAPVTVVRAADASPSGDDEVRRMLAELKSDISSLKSAPVAAAAAAAPAPAAADDEVRRMLAELKNDISSLKAAPAPAAAAPAAPAPAADDEVRRMLAELKGDISSLKSSIGQAQGSVAAQGSDVHGLINRLQGGLGGMAGEATAGNAAAREGIAPAGEPVKRDEAENNGNKLVGGTSL